MESLLNKIKEHKVVSIIRSDSLTSLEETVNSLYEGGVRMIEITMNTPGALKGIEKIRSEFSDLIVGAGTVLDSESARLAILSGASFLLSPTLNKSTIEMANRYDTPIVPGVLTPTEALTAHQFGASMVKFFPARQLGPSYFGDLNGPLPQIDTMAVGGISLKNAESFLNGGADSIGIGSSLVDEKLVKQKDFAEIKKRAKQFVTIAQSIKGK